MLPEFGEEFMARKQWTPESFLERSLECLGESGHSLSSNFLPLWVSLELSAIKDERIPLACQNVVK